MSSFSLSRTGWVIFCTATLAAAACGSDDGKKTSPPRQPSAGEGGEGARSDGNDNGGAGNAAAGGASGESGAPNPNGEGGMSTTAGASAGDAGTTGVGDGGAGGADDPGEVCVTDPAPTACAVGTADCDDDPSDCETDVATDASNCGRCERACGGSATCSAGLCSGTVLLNPNVSSNWCGAAFSDTTAYMITCWGNNDLSEVRTAPLEPGADVLGTSIKAYNNVSVVALRGIVIDGNDVLFGLQESPSHLYKFPRNATGPADVSVGYTFENNQRFDELQLIGDTFWWNHNTHTTPGTVTPSTIEKRTKTAQTSTVVVSGLGQSYALKVFDEHIIWLEQRTQQGVASVYRAPIAGGTAADTELIAAATAGAYMKRQGDYVYWTHKAAAPNGMLRRFKADDPNATVQNVATGLNLPEGLITDEKYAYFRQLDALYRVPLCGGTPEQLSPVIPAHDQQATQLWHVDDKYVYFSAGAGFGDSTLVRVAK